MIHGKAIRWPRSRPVRPLKLFRSIGVARIAKRRNTSSWPLPVTERAAALQLAFRRIAATRMLDMPLRNAALEVEAVGFRAWQGHEVGVLITPWSVSLVVLPGGALRPLTLDERQSWQFPSGSYEFMGGNEPECGPYHFCSLFSPPGELADHAQAREVAAAVMEQLFRGARTVSRRALLGAAEPDIRA